MDEAKRPPEKTAEAAGKRASVTPAEAKHYMLITWFCTAIMAFMAIYRPQVTGKPTTALHLIVLGLLVIAALAATRAYFKMKRAQERREDRPAGKRAKG